MPSSPKLTGSVGVVELQTIDLAQGYASRTTDNHDMSRAPFCERCWPTASLLMCAVLLGVMFGYSGATAADSITSRLCSFEVSHDGERHSPNIYICSTPGEHYCCGTRVLETQRTVPDRRAAHQPFPAFTNARAAPLAEHAMLVRRTESQTPPLDSPAFIFFGNFRS